MVSLVPLKLERSKKQFDCGYSISATDERKNGPSTKKDTGFKGMHRYPKKANGPPYIGDICWREPVNLEDCRRSFIGGVGD